MQPFNTRKYEHVTASSLRPIRLSDSEKFVNAFGHRAAYLISAAVHKLDVEKVSWNRCLGSSYSDRDRCSREACVDRRAVDIFRISVAHSQYLIIQTFAAALSDSTVTGNPPLLQILKYRHWCIISND
jgi:acyl-CoA oxidase